MNDQRLGIVRLEISGQAIPLRFTWDRIDSLGRNGITTLLTKAESGGVGDVSALADLLVVASGGEVSAEAIKADPPPINAAYLAIMEAWALALYGPAMEAKPGGEPENPPFRLRTWLSTLFRRQ